MKKINLLLILIIATILLSGCGKKENSQNSILLNIPDQQPQSVKVIVTIKNHAFDPQTITITNGTKITWENKDGATHQIEGDSEPEKYHIKSFESWLVNPYKDWTFTFDGKGFFGEAWDIEYKGEGVFNYHCKLHPDMKGTIIVKAVE
jgi:plastocyanin